MTGTVGGAPARVTGSTPGERVADAIRVEIPPRYCPLPYAEHPDAGLLNARAADWLNGYGLCREGAHRVRMTGNDCGGFYGRIMPRAPAGRLQIAVDWCVLMFAFDDLHCDEGPASLRTSDFSGLATRLLRVLEAPGTQPGAVVEPFLAATADLAARCRAAGTPVQTRRMVEGHRAWFLGVLWEFGCRLRGRTPSLDDYARMRQHSAAGAATFSWTEIVDGEEIPERELVSPAVRALRELAFTTAAFDDDLFSYGKEQWLAAHSGHGNGCRLNLVDVLVEERSLSLAEAMEEAVALNNRLTARFVQLRDRVLPGASRPVRRHLGHLSTLIRGNLEWGLHAGRYTDPDGRHPAAVVTTGSFTEAVPPAGPPGIPSLSWWWDRL
ncbi:terpene synthase family protein [Streptomyces sp. SCA3-4]|uniref:terpene synthase family protein n=1 Tax=Streptomyces sichuanensis TaxID=2871810 RepID=UPI001CE250AD|nr:terpene synthase family protein [Streptomyces sichuanensis]MCA6091415.1 terpene synthase family protein [Streptomyces sichuanensis]